jgi:glutamyl-tRNA synthetase
MSMEELINKFSFAHCSKSGAKFAFEKGKWFNHEYLMNTPGEQLAEMFRPQMLEHGVNPDDFSTEYVAKALDLVKGRAELLPDLWEQGYFFFQAPEAYAEKDIRKRWKPETPQLMEELIGVLESLTDFSSAAAEPIVLKWITDNEYHMGNVMNAFRLAVVGQCKGPHMFDITELLGCEETVKRLRKAIANITLPEA